MVSFEEILKSPGVEPARSYWNANVSYSFTPLESFVIEKFFTNSDKKVFFIHFLPSSIISTLLAMYSRLENPRGIRGHFVDNLLPAILASLMEEFQTDEDLDNILERIKKFIKGKKLDDFQDFSKETRRIVAGFIDSCANPNFFGRIASSARIKGFLGMFMDSYGHNSIARPANVVFCVENCSTLTAKSLEWVRPASGPIELSTRFVRMDKKVSGVLYPFWLDMGAISSARPSAIASAGELAESLFAEYCGRMNDENGQNSLSKFFREKYAGIFEPKDLEKGVKGEVCDVLGNFLPVATLTSLGIGVSGESFSGIIKCLILDRTPENFALAEFIISEAAKTGANQFLRHFDPTEWEREFWGYLPRMWLQRGWDKIITKCGNLDRKAIERDIREIYKDTPFEGIILNPSIPRTEFDKLPSDFENFSFWVEGLMSFRGWRDLHRQSFCNHKRGYVTPYIGIYQYNKPAPQELNTALREVNKRCKVVFDLLTAQGISPAMSQYAMPLGSLISFQVGANLREWEFCNWQRSKPDVNHEVRQVFLSIEKEIRERLPWWEKLSRANMTPGYVFARTNQKVAL